MYVLGSPLGAIDPSGHSACNDFDDCERPGTKADLDQQTYTFPQFVRWPVGNSIGYGFGPIKNAKNNAAYWYTSGLHGGVDLFAPAGSPVKAGLYGKYSEKYITDAKYNSDNVVIESEGYYVVYGHVDLNSSLKPGDDVTPDTVIGVVGEWYTSVGMRIPANDHVHLSILKEDPSGWTSYNPILFATPSVANSLTIDGGSVYAPGQSATSMFSFKYTTINYWTSSNQERRSLIGVVPWVDRVSPMWRTWLMEEFG